MSLAPVFEAFKRTKEHLRKQEITAQYRFVSDRLESTNELFQMWLKLYKLYADGYQRELLTWSNSVFIKNISVLGRVLETKLARLFEAKISSDVYILLDNIFKELNQNASFYVVAEGDGFAQRSVYNEIFNYSLRKLSPPRKIKIEEYNELERKIKERDTAILYYERGQHDNPFSWLLLLHEVMHWLYHSEGLDSIEEKISEKPKWLNEVLIDLYIANLFGPSYATSLAYHLYRFPHEETKSHPHWIFRLYTCYKYLADLTKDNTLPPPLDKEVRDALSYIEEVQKHHEFTLSVAKDKIDMIYDQAYALIIDKIMKKTKPFVSFIQEMKTRRDECKNLNPKEHQKKRVYFTTDVQLYYDLGIPIAAHPRVLFNSFISKKYLDYGVNLLFVKESLKRYYVQERWRQIS